MGILKRLSSRFHLALGLSSLVVTLLLGALFAGLLPDRDSALREGRTALAEATGLAVSVVLSDEEDTRLQQVLDFIVSRNAHLLAIEVQQGDGQLRAVAHRPGQDGKPLPPAAAAGETAAKTAAGSAAPNHGGPSATTEHSSETDVRVPLLANGGLWGRAVLRFTPLEGSSFSFQRGSPALLVLLLGLGCFVTFYLYLRRMLRHLDPSNVVPGRVRTAFDTLAEGVLVLDPEGKVVLANKAFVDVVGGTAEALVGRPADQLGWSQPEGASPEETPWASLRGDGLARRSVLLYLTGADGKRRSFMSNGSPVPGAGGKPAGMLVSLDDVTELQEQEVQLRLARDAAEQANRAKSDFLANMSHEIRTPMNAILGFAELLRRGWTSDAAQSQRHLDTIVGSGRHLLTLINDILDLSKVEAGRLEVEQTDCPVHEVVREVLDIMQARADEKGVALKLVFPRALPATLQTDPARLRQIVTNLVGNALKFTAKGQVGVRVRLAKDESSGLGILRIDVSDTGIGIPSNKLESIFDPFAQAEASTTRQFGGTGLGLTISRRFARALGGDIVATSVPGQGSTFHISLAVAAPSDDQAWLEPEELGRRHAPAAAADANKRWQFAPATVLVVDDGIENRELVRLVLEGAGLQVVEAENGAIALTQVAQHQPALVLMDVQMPVMDGYTATSKLREQGFTLPVLALTANAMKGFEREIAASGFDGYLTKPVDIDLLLATLAEHLQGSLVEVTPTAVAAVPAAPATPALQAVSLTGASRGGSGAESTEPIHSRLAGHDRLSRVVRTFGQTLPLKLKQMQVALEQGRYTELAEGLHWLKGAGGTVGFDVFFEPARQLEAFALEQRREELEAGLLQLQRLAGRLVMPPEVGKATRDIESLPVLDEALS